MPKFNRNFVTLIVWGEMKGTPPVLNLETDLTAPCPRPAIPPIPGRADSGDLQFNAGIKKTDRSLTR